MAQYTIEIYSMDQATGDFGSGGPLGTAGGLTTDAVLTPITVVVEDDDLLMDHSDAENGTVATVVSSSDLTINALAGQTIQLTGTSANSNDNTISLDGTSEGVQSVSIGGNANWFVSEDYPMEAGTTYADSPINGTGLGAVSYSQIEPVVCFTTGMRFKTKDGLLAVEDLEVGQEVETFDNGSQPIRFIYRRKVPATGAHAPLVFEKGALGDNERFVVSQKHRIHTSMVGKDHPAFRVCAKDCLIEANQLINGTSIRVLTSETEVEYFHVMFDKHELVWSEGVLSETWQPHRRNLRRDKGLRKELLSIFPEIGMKGKVDGSPVRRPIYPNIVTSNA